MDNTALKKWLRTRASNLPVATDRSLKELAASGGRAQDHLIKNGDLLGWVEKKGDRWSEEDTTTLLKFMQGTTKGPLSTLEMVECAAKLKRPTSSIIYRVAYLLGDTHPDSRDTLLQRVLF